jgi:choline kinase
LKCVIIAAGMGSRLANHNTHKALIRVGGTALIERAVQTALAAGCSDFTVVVGYRGEEVKEFLIQVEKRHSCTISTVTNPQWKKENGLSVLSARKTVNGKFILLMSDHIFDYRILKELAHFPLPDDELVLAVDTRIDNHPNVDMDDVTKVASRNGLIRDIGKNIPEYNAFDTGIFFSSPHLFTALEASMESGDFTLSGGVRVMIKENKARVMEVGNKLWIDVDDNRALERAEAIIPLMCQ